MRLNNESVGKRQNNTNENRREALKLEQNEKRDQT